MFCRDSRNLKEFICNDTHHIVEYATDIFVYEKKFKNYRIVQSRAIRQTTRFEEIILAYLFYFAGYTYYLELRIKFFNCYYYVPTVFKVLSTQFLFTQKTYDWLYVIYHLGTHVKYV